MNIFNACMRIIRNPPKALLTGLVVAIFTTGCIESYWEKQVVANPSAFKVSATVLSRDFDTNKSAANKKYKGQIIEVYGPVQETHSEGDKTLVILRGDKGEEIFCPVSSAHSADLDNLESGRISLIKGKCRGIVRGNVTLGGCIIQDPLQELKTKARSGDISAQYALATALSKPNDAACDIKWAFHLYCKLAESGHEESLATLTQALMGAWSPETNAPVIWSWLQEEAEAGNVEACYQLGLLHSISEEFGINLEQSVPWFKKAADGGHQDAIFTMAMFNYEGKVVPTNKLESARLLSLVDLKTLPRAAEVLGIMMLTGDGVPKDVKMGLSLLESAAVNGRAQSAAILGFIHLAGELAPKDEYKALAWLIKAGEMGHARSMAKAGLILSDDKDEASQRRGHDLIMNALSNDTQVVYSEIFSHVADNVTERLEALNPPLVTNDHMRFRQINGTMVQGVLQSKADNWLVLHVNTNLVTVQFNEIDVAGRTRCDPAFRQILSQSLVLEKFFELIYEFKAPEPENIPTNDLAIILKDLAENGDPEAQALLGTSLMREKPSIQNGLEWLRKSVDGGCPEGQHALGMAYLKGLGQPANTAEAFRLFSLAADQGHLESLLQAGQMLMTAEGCDRDTRAGLALVRKAAEGLNFEAILFMGRHYYGNMNRMRDPAQAFVWFRLGTSMWSPEAEYWLGRMYYEGNGIPADYNRAVQWLMKSASQGYKPAVALLDSDAASKRRMAKAKQDYLQDLERHSARVEEIRNNPKYDLILLTGRLPSSFSERDKEAYKRFRASRDSGASLPEAKLAAWGWRGKTSLNRSHNTSGGYIPTGSASWRDSWKMTGGGRVPVTIGLGNRTDLDLINPFGLNF